MFDENKLKEKALNTFIITGQGHSATQFVIDNMRVVHLTKEILNHQLEQSKLDKELHAFAQKLVDLEKQTLALDAKLIDILIDRVNSKLDYSDTLYDYWELSLNEITEERKADINSIEKKIDAVQSDHELTVKHIMEEKEKVNKDKVIYREKIAEIDLKKKEIFEEIKIKYQKIESIRSHFKEVVNIIPYNLFPKYE